MSFLERKLSKDFCQEATAECLQNINDLSSFNLVSIPGVGISYFLRFLSTRNKNHKFIHINTYEMPEFTKDELFRQLAAKSRGPKQPTNNDASLAAIKQNIDALCQLYQRVVIVFNRFDRLAGILDQNLSDNLTYLRSNQSKMVMIFVTSNPMYETHHQILSNSSKIFTKTTYFKPYSPRDLLQVARLDGLPLRNGPLAAKLSGGHHSLFHTLLRCQDINNPLSDPMDEMMVKQFYLSLNARRREVLGALVEGKRVSIDDYLTGTGIIKIGADGQPELFTPLLTKYILQQGTFSLPHKERRLLNLLKRNCGKLVRKNEIFDHIWGDEVAGDWALNSLVYRLRRHPGFDAQRYTIKSVKKDGYILVDNQIK
jgi:hypothetical protein